MKKKLVVFHPALAPYRIDFFNGLSEIYDASFYFSTDNLKDQKFDQERLRAKCNFEFRLLRYGFELGKRSLRFGILNKINKHKADIIICSEYSQITLSVLFYKYFLGKKYKVYTISDDSLDLSGKRSGIRKWLRDYLSNYFDGVIFPSDKVCTWYHKNVNSKTRLISLPIIHNNDIFRQRIAHLIPVANENIRKYDLNNKKVFIYVGRLVAIKNIPLLINAFAYSKNNMENARLIIIGDGKENNNLREQVAKSGLDKHCIFTGRLEGDELASWFLVADCLVLPSYQEPYGAVVNEALLAGCKVLCSNLAGAADLITEENGAFFDPYNSNELSELLVNIYNETVRDNSTITVKPDLMPFHFDEKFNKLISFIEINDRNPETNKLPSITKEEFIAPICLFTYNRLSETRRTIEALQKNYLSPDSDLIIFSDGPKNENSHAKVMEVRRYLRTINGFKSVTIHESQQNKGLANSIIDGITQVINQYGYAIVLEDDIVTTPNFLSYINQSLNFYQDNEQIISVCGYGLKIKKPTEYVSDVYLYRRSSSWGWATWKDRWNEIDWEVKDWNDFKKNKKEIKEFKSIGSDMFKMLKSVTEGNAQSWAIRFCYSQFKQKKYSIMPFKSLVENIGFGEDGTNTHFKFSRFKIEKDNGIETEFVLNRNITLNSEIQKSCYKYHSIPIRIYSRIRYTLGL